MVKQANAETRAISDPGAAAEARAEKAKAAQTAAELMAEAGEAVPDGQLDEETADQDDSDDEEWDAFVDSRMPCVLVSRRTPHLSAICCDRRLRKQSWLVACVRVLMGAHMQGTWCCRCRTEGNDRGRSGAPASLLSAAACSA